MAIRVGYLDPFPPFAWREGGGHRGLVLEALATAAAARGERLLFRPGAVAELPAALAAGAIDAIAAKAVTAERAGTFAFSRPLARTAAALFAPAGRAAPAIQAAAGAVVATPGDGPLALLLPRLAPGVRVLAVADYGAALAAVGQGAADFAALNADAGAAVAARLGLAIGPPGPRFAPLALALAVPAGDPARILDRLGLG